MYGCAVFSRNGNGVTIRHFVGGKLEISEIPETNNRAEILKFLDRTRLNSFTVSEFQISEHASKEYTVWYSLPDELKPAEKWSDL
jgi:hypothetical protein